jgi:hypothetical protein
MPNEIHLRTWHDATFAKLIAKLSAEDREIEAHTEAQRIRWLGRVSIAFRMALEVEADFRHRCISTGVARHGRSVTMLLRLLCPSIKSKSKTAKRWGDCLLYVIDNGVTDAEASALIISTGGIVATHNAWRAAHGDDDDDDRPDEDDDEETDTAVRLKRWRAINDKRQTSPDCARRVIGHFAGQFKPSDTFCDPTAGAGAFLNAMVDAGCGSVDSYEIDRQHGQPRDFLQCNKHYTWIMTNPPWSIDAYEPIFKHALAHSDNVVFLVRLQNAIATTARRRDWQSAGFGLKEIAICGWQDAGFPSEGYELAAIHWQRGYCGDVRYGPNQGTTFLT